MIEGRTTDKTANTAAPARTTQAIQPAQGKVIGTVSAIIDATTAQADRKDAATIAEIRMACIKERSGNMRQRTKADEITPSPTVCDRAMAVIPARSAALDETSVPISRWTTPSYFPRAQNEMTENIVAPSHCKGETVFREA